ncbi:hypothetical protein BH11MYX2_BH11MYX2_12260 [soil metagenome]
MQNKLNADPMCGDLFLFVNESRKLCKVLVSIRRAGRASKRTQ